MNDSKIAGQNYLNDFSEKDGIYQIERADNVAAVTIQDAPPNLKFLQAVLTCLAGEHILVDMISMTPPSGQGIQLTFTVADQDIVKTSVMISRLKADYPFLRPVISIGNSKITVSGAGMKQSIGIAARAMTAILREQAEVYLITTSERDISFLMPCAEADFAYIALKRYFKVADLPEQDLR